MLENYNYSLLESYNYILFISLDSESYAKILWNILLKIILYLPDAS